MEIKAGQYAGFCFGADRALKVSMETPAGNGRVFTYGEIIHNRQAVAVLERRGIYAIHHFDELLQDDTVIIRAHGVGPDVYEALEKTCIRVLDATCPYAVSYTHLTLP